ncbi:glycoside hydrolase family 2 TIM barrel-domain containing protein [Danxiaibacter flavus]|uniref:Glycoside hydrolase family 2 TIM barrel-domain containing protein n=1 Tax=Danxiaibacter flavus TaxID=3049108 RepID=A0ABV3ZDD7_9BACT|nr:glycoside hydrolase family 2 TIM barrel-domain containing protein [Chitinophagaceae bacterium DXS]
MKKRLFFTCVSAFLLLKSEAQWAIAPGKITTEWSASVTADKPLPEYPRPQMTRTEWVNLNGLWQYAIQPKAQQENMPAKFDGNILVPYAVESALSGVAKTVGKDSVLWYKRTLTISPVKNKKVLLHFGAVDWLCDVFVNGQPAGSHKGGYDPFTLDITSLIKKGSQQEVSVRVWDPSDDGPQPRGKQVKKPEGIWYTPVTGIWQTVWMETVPSTYISSTVQTPDIDKKTVNIVANTENLQQGDLIKVTAFDGAQKLVEKSSNSNDIELEISSPKLWSPAQPFLYDLSVQIVRNGKVVDEVKSYFAMRKSSIGVDKNGIQRMLLNNEFVFQYGPLDQGWWPDGLYTAPTDEALKFDIVKTKEMGFNMIRKHVKVEPARWYYYCDKEGMLVWQDMPSGDLGNRWEPRPAIVGRATDKDRTAESENIYRTEWNAIMEALHNFPSIIVWTPFNEAWGQFKTEDIVNWTMKKDPSRVVNTASGGNFHDVGHIIDLHNYPDPAMPDPVLFGSKRAIVLGEFGGLGLPVEGHTWQQKDNWGYQTFKNSDDLLKRYSAMVDKFPDLIRKGLSAAVYTQTTDVEVETNGLMTYDRKVTKMPAASLKSLHQKLYDASLVKK